MEKTLCDNCKHYIGKLKCRAYPKEPGIPIEIIEGENDHTEIQKDQVRTFVFEEKK